MKIWKKLVLIYFVIVLVKVLLSYFIPSISSFSDGYFYAKAARSFFLEGSFLVHGIDFGKTLLLYPIVLSVSYLFNDMNLVYFSMKAINVIISSLIIFPTFLLAKEFLSRKRALKIAFLVSIIPVNFVFSNYLMAENLLYPLFLFAVYFIYKSFADNNLWMYALALIFSGLSVFTKLNSVVLFLVMFIMPFVSYFILKKKINKIMFIVPLLVVLGSIFLFSNILNSVLVQYYLNYYNSGILFDMIKGNYPWFNLIAKFLLSISVVFLGSGLIFFLMSFFIKLRNYKTKVLVWITLLVSFFVLAIGANHGVISRYDFFKWLPHRPIGRYLDLILPLIIILGFIGFKYFEMEYKKNKDKLVNLLWIFTPLALYSSLLVFFPLFPINNMSLTWLGGLKYASDYLFFGIRSFGISYSFYSLFGFGLFFILLLGGVYFLYRKDLLKMDKLYVFIVMFFVLSSVSAYAVSYYNVNTYWDGEQIQIGKWFNDYDEGSSVVLFNEIDCSRRILKLEQDSLCEPSKSTTLMGFWMNDDIIIGNASEVDGVDFVVSRQELEFEVVKESESGLKIYKVS